jgi:hypothetical protein
MSSGKYIQMETAEPEKRPTQMMEETSQILYFVHKSKLSQSGE